MANALICGAGGFIGGYCLSAFRNAGWLTTGAGHVADSGRQFSHSGPFIAGDFRDKAFVRHLLSQDLIERIVFAAGPSDVQRSFDDPVSDFEKQTLPLLNLLDESRKLRFPPGVLLVSSAAVYGSPAHVPVSELAPATPISPYGFHKLQQELLLDEYSALYGLPTAKARVFSTYGPGLRHLAVWDIASRALRGEIGLWGTGQESRDYLHALDVASALEHVSRASAFEGEVVNIASGKETLICTLAEFIFAKLSIPDAPTFSGSGLLGSPVCWRADISRLTSLGFEPAVSLQSGLSDTLHWIKQNA